MDMIIYHDSITIISIHAASDEMMAVNDSNQMISPIGLIINYL